MLVIVFPALALVLGTHGFVPMSISSSLLKPEVTSGSSPKLSLSNGPQSKPVMTKHVSVQSTSGLGSSPPSSGFLLAPSSAFFSAKETQQEPSSNQDQFGSSPPSSGHFQAPSSAFFSSKKTQQEPSSNHDDEKAVRKKETENLKKKVEKLVSKTKQQEAMIKNLQDVQKDLLADKSGSKTEIKELTARVEEKESTITFLREKLNASSAECKTEHMKSLKRMLTVTSSLRKCKEKLKAKNKKYELVDGCPSTFTNAKKADICFGIIKKMSNFKDAEADCENTYNGRLAVLDTKDKLNIVRSKLTIGHVHQSVWVGGQQVHSDFKWVDGSTMSPDFGWAPGEPNNDLEQCVDLHYMLKYKMNDEKCDTYIGYVCEVPK